MRVKNYKFGTSDNTCICGIKLVGKLLLVLKKIFAFINGHSF